MIKAFQRLQSVKSLKNKYLSLAILAVLFSTSVHAQYDSTKTLQPVSAYGNAVKNERVLGAFWPSSDTFKLAVKDSGAMSVKNGSVYTFNGFAWVKISVVLDTTSPSGLQTKFKADTSRNNTYAAINGKQATITPGTSTQYLKADLTIGNDMNNEVTSGSTNSNIALANVPVLNSVKLLKNGVRLPPVKYSVSGLTVTLTDPRLTTDIFQADYKY